jgi:hypothetical protein
MGCHGPPPPPHHQGTSDREREPSSALLCPGHSTPVSLLRCRVGRAQSGIFPIAKQDRPSELHLSIRYVGDYYAEFDTLFGCPSAPSRPLLHPPSLPPPLFPLPSTPPPPPSSPPSPLRPGFVRSNGSSKWGWQGGAGHGRDGVVEAAAGPRASRAPLIQGPTLDQGRPRQWRRLGGPRAKCA